MKADTKKLIETAQKLMAASFNGLLSTQSHAHPGYPFGSLVPFYRDRDGYPLMLLSHLAQHSKNLLADSRCGLLVSETSDNDPQQCARLSMIAECAPSERLEAEEIQRFFRYFPHMQPYYEQLNFRFFRCSPTHFHLNAGFAAARLFGRERILQTTALATPDEKSLMAQWSDKTAELAQLAGLAMKRHAGDTQRSEQIKIAGIDHAGIDLRFDEQIVRLFFRQPADTANGVNAELDRLSRPARTDAG
jgi:hypothetical protein